MIREIFYRNPHLLFYGIFAMAAIVLRLPVIGRYFRTVNTLLHESGHALGAILSSGEVVHIELNKDTSGTAYTKSGSKSAAMFVSFAGYPFAAFASGLLIWLTVTNQYNLVFLILLTIALLNLMLFIRNTYGIIWLITFSGLIVLVAWIGNPSVSRIFTLSVSLISFAETIMSTLTIFYLGLTSPRKAGDLTNLAKTSKVPALIWALLITGLVGMIVYFTIINYFPNPLQPINFSVVQ